MNETQDTTQHDVWVPISEIVIPEDARPHTQADIDSRAVSMAREGQAQPALLSKEGDKLVLVYGNGRLLSAKKLNWEKLRCDIKEGLTETQKLMLALEENVERQDESPFHTAMVYQKLMAAKGLTQEQLATELGKELKTINRYLSLTRVAAEVQKIGHACPIGLRQCLEIAKLTKVEDQQKVMEECVTEDLAGKALEKRVKQLLNLSAGQAGPKPADSDAAEKPAAVPPTFRFTWKNGVLMIKVQPFDPEREPLTDYIRRFVEASEAYIAAFPAPQKPAVEVPQAV